MTKTITDSQVLGELGETAVKKIVLETGFIYEHRGRLEAGTDGLIELRDPKSGAPLGKLLAVQVKATKESQYLRETDKGFEYLLRPADLKLWRLSNIPVIIVLWRQSDGSAYWKDVTDSVRGEERRLQFDKAADVFDPGCADRLGALTVDRRKPGVFVPPLNGGETAIINLLRIKLPEEIFIATSPFGSGRDAVPELLKHSNTRFDWVIRKRRYVSFFDPREYGTKAIVDVDQVEAIDSDIFAFNDDLDDTNDTMDLLRRTVERQLSAQVSYLRKERLFYFHAVATNKSRSYRYLANVKETSAKVVSAYTNKKNPEGRGYVRHHAATFRFERLADEWFVVVDPTFYFTNDGFRPHRYPEALLAGKKRLERNAAVRGQVVMWQHLLVESASCNNGLFDQNEHADVLLDFENLPVIELSRAVPESSWTRTDPRAKEMESRDLFDEGGAA
ncbi:protein of unknown function [Enhydrobacter aerosaccus]|uniref:DUF4365 domain-containing protein n=1 Tax=Enhydrobacter aerosaccus TaxID=225324 RepID=A0A1T4TDU6_9HYPH|nr:DUF4365 domain-containing protein [Enhydrobacter aerosaccus]SKA38665.1 protein of unknown function [Enhydrobacter aerosaccus]